MKTRNRGGNVVGRAANQRGVVLFIVLIVLVAMSMAAISMFRSSDTGSMIAGNLAFKQSALLSADKGVEEARTWVNGNLNILDVDNPAKGYYATRQDSLDFMGSKTPEKLSDDVDWDGKNTEAVVKAVVLPTDSTTGNQVSYVVHRLCETSGGVNDPGQACAVATMLVTGSTNDAVDYTNQPLTSKATAYYRITARIVGPRNTVSYVQATILP
jgi:type IV pilus assembly protein PilX